MSEYTPDRWEVIELVWRGATVRKVFSGMYGGFAGSDTWKLSSAIQYTEDRGGYFEFTCESGSVYTCYKNAQGMSGYMRAIFQNWVTQQSGEVTLEVVEP
jgi:hypothetical protein